MRFKRENKGFSLIELIVVIAIFSVVGVVVGGFLLTASRSYAVSANELDLQEESQLVANQIQEMILDTSYGIAYQFVGLDDEGNNLVEYMENDAVVLPEGSTISQKDLYIYGKDHYYHIFWNKEASQILLKEYEKNADDAYVLVEGMPTTGVLFGEYISDFKVDLSKVASDRMVSFNITFKKDGSDRDYLVARTVSLRNNVMTNKTADEIYEAAGEEFQPAADDLDVDPDDYSMWPGETLHYNVLLKCSNGGVPSQIVNWTLNPLSGKELDANTKINASNILQVSENEQNDQIEAIATAAGYDYSTNTPKPLKKVCKVNIRQIQSLSIVSNELEDFQISRGGTYDIKVTMSGLHMPDNLADTGGILASFKEGGDYAIVTETNVEGLVATFTVEVLGNAPANGAIKLSFTPKRIGNESAAVDTNTYYVSDSEQIIFSINDADQKTQWLRLGTANTILEFKDNFKNMYTVVGNDKKLKKDHIIRYIYKLYDSKDNLIETASKTTIINDEGVLVPGFSKIDINPDNALTSKAMLSDKVFLQSGKVVVSAELLRYDDRTEKYLTLGKSDEYTYSIPAATLRFRRSLLDVGESEMISYITNKQKETSIYIEFADGFEPGSSYTISLDKVECHVEGCDMEQCSDGACGADKYASVNQNKSSESDKKIVIKGSDKNSRYGANQKNKIVLSYDNIPAPNIVTVVLAVPNVAGTNYYVPLESEEWTQVETKKVTEGKNTVTYTEYVYYIDDTHRMEITYRNKKFNKAQLCELVGLNWDINKEAYKISDNSWKKK